ncbi:exocyst complex component EXO70A1-like isoform X1 [Camellia sinensis]|uniref:exocyst complex component EXO70A1-like isoform X1 n=2 Tax=Camellia sinensis TaxID=4442 RepID=UPI0010356127|nr:exocyst complex component EXO70A1-like isoform X1 [Camellia sinensis]
MLYRPPVHYTPCQKGTNLSSNIILVSICIYKETSTNKSSSSSLSLSLDQNCLVRTVKQNSVERERENCGGEMGVPTVGIDVLSDRAAMMRESLLKSQSITDSAVSVLGSFDHRLSALETAMRPTQIRTHAIRKAHENIDKTLKAAEVILDQFDLFRQVEAKILKGPREDLESYLEAIEQLRSSIRFFSNNKSFKSSDGVLNHTNSLLSKAISKLEEEFKQLLSSYSKPVEPERLFECLPSELRPSPESPGNQGNSNGKNSHTEHHNHNLENAVYTLPTLILPRILPLLHNLAQQMVKAGHQQQLLKIYRDTRSSVLEESLLKLGVEKLSKDDVQKMQWEVLEAKIGNWIHFMRIAVKLVFAGERKVCNHMFEGIDSLRDQCFAEVTASSVAVLLSFGEAIAKSKRSPEKLFVLLDMYEIMRELHSEIETLFKGKACSEIRESALSLMKQLAQTAQETFGDFEEAVEKDATKTAVLDGTVHPLTSYVINYVKFLFDYQSTLKQLFQEFENGGETNSQLASVTMRIMQALQTNLDGKSKQYKDPALNNLFLMNNIHYMVRSVRRSEAKDLLGDDWVQRHRRIVQQHANQYKRIAWAKILQCLSVPGLNSSGGSGNSVGGDGGNSSGASRTIVKDRLKTFNIQFEELHQRQSQWTVPDTELRESLKLAVAEVLLPAYRSFIKRFGLLVENGKNPQKYIRYTAEDLDRMLGEFFEGMTLNEPKR